jgi:hypothetical protein
MMMHRSGAPKLLVSLCWTNLGGASTSMFEKQCMRVARSLSLAVLLLTLASAGPAVAQTAVDGCEPFADFDSAVFEPPTAIDNKWFPLTPGTRFTFVGEANLGDEEVRILPRIVVFTVTDMIKVIDGVETLVIWDQDFAIDEEGEQFLVEEELAFFVQDQDGNVWNLGEYPEEFEDGEFAGAPSTWIQGVKDAQGGIIVLGRLGRQRLGTEYLEGLVPSIEFFDCGRVHRKLRRVRVGDEIARNIVVIRERDPFDPEGGIQQKYYARNVGLVKVDAVDDPEGEILNLVEQVTLGPGGLAIARQNVKRLESNAYNSEDKRVRFVYGKTDPAQQLPADDAGAAAVAELEGAAD